MLYVENIEQLDAGIENESEWINGTIISIEPVQPRKVVDLERWANIFKTFSSWTKPIHSVLDQNFQKDRAPCLFPVWQPSGL